MQLHFEPITSQNRAAALALQIRKEQTGYIESVEQCLKEADRLRLWHPVGIYDADMLVGFAMYGLFPAIPRGRLWLDRLLIDARFQAMGYGKAALAGLLQHLSASYPRHKTVYLSVVQGNDAAIGLYRQFGFVFNGKKDIHGEDIMVRTA